ncbi:MAG: hypothetical protein GX096_02850 [Clostridiales bacterium]|nr:hypothetical protein [Clostridiales bacterium]
MRKPAFLSNQRLSRFLVSLLMCLGLSLPLLMTFGLSQSVVLSIAVSVGVIGLLTVIGSAKKGRLFEIGLLIVIGIVQFFLPNMGLFGAAMDAFKAVELYFKGITPAVILFSGSITIVISIGVALVSYVFTRKEVGFVPAAIVVVLVLFGIWTLGETVHLWYALPAILALLLLVAQSTHEKINLFEVLPMAVIVVVLAMLILPSGNTTFQPLYQSAMRLKQTITDYLFFTEQRNVFTLGSYGYYPMSSGKLGGEANPNENPVMMVKTDKRTLLRAVVKDEYTGRSWRDTSGGKRYLYIDPRWSQVRTRAFLMDMPSKAVLSASKILDQHAVNVQMQNTATSTIFTPVFLRKFTAQSDMVGYFNDASEMFITRDLARDDAYAVFAPIFEGGDNGLGALVAAAPKGSDAYYQTMISKYTALPDHIEDKVYSDVKNIAAAATTPYEQATAIMRHLQRYYRYTLSPKTPPENQDFVTYFLYVEKEGYCTYFASAMTVMCRMIGLPTRYVEGFLAEPAGDGIAYVTGMDAHAWTEVYFEGFGWIPFDATPSQENLNNENQDEPEPSPSPSPSPSPQPDEPNADPTPSPEPETPDEEPSPQPDEDMDNPPEPPDEKPPSNWWLWLLAVAAIGGIVYRIHSRMPKQMAKRQTDEQDAIFIYGNATFLVMRLLGRNPRKGETPLLFARRMDKQKAFPVPILPLWRMMALSNYSKAQPAAEQTARAKDTFERMYKPQNPLLKLRFMFKVAFGKNSYHGLDTKQEYTKPETQYNYFAQQASKKNKKSKIGKAQKPSKNAAEKTGKQAKKGKAKPEIRPEQTQARQQRPTSKPMPTEPEEQSPNPPDKNPPSTNQRRSRSQRNRK